MLIPEWSAGMIAIHLPVMNNERSIASRY